MTTDIIDTIDNLSPVLRAESGQDVINADSGQDVINSVLPQNCHGCKWLDEVRTRVEDIYALCGAGYCAMVVRSPSYRPGDRIRTMFKLRCELYAAGDFKDRYNQADSEGRNGRV